MNMDTIPAIDYRKIADAKDFYSREGFLHLDVPWIVGHESYCATKPAHVRSREFHTLDGYLNASAEQSFIELMERGHALTKHLAITPCFRDEPMIDETHYKYFLKLELIDMTVTGENLERMMAVAMRFFERYMPVSIVKTGVDAFDICDKKHNIELGSYGIRHFKNNAWVYGTGLALPRFDVVLAKY